MIDKQRYVVNKDWETLFDGILHECAEDLRRDPSDFPSLVRGVTVYMIVIEGMLALTAARFMIKSLKERNAFPGFTAGFTAVNRDESRHVGFGVKFLADAIKDDRANAKIVEDTLKECLPVAPLVFVPPWVDDPYDFQTPFYHSRRSTSTRRRRSRRSWRRWAWTRRRWRARGVTPGSSGAGPTAAGLANGGPLRGGGPPPAPGSGSSRPRSRC